MEEEVKQKTKKKGLVAIIILAIIAIALICGVVYYSMVYTKTDATFKRVIGKTIDSYQQSLAKEDYKTLDATMGLDVQVNPINNDEDMQTIVDLINALKIELNTQIDKDQRIVNVKLNSTYESENFLNVEASMDAKNEKMYVGLKDFFDKYIDAGELEEGTFESLNEIFDNMYTKEQQNNLSKSYDIIENEIKGIIKEEYCSSEKKEITVNNKKVNATKNTISMTMDQLINELLVVCNNLKNNEEFINCYEDKEEVRDTLEQFIEELENEKGLYEEDYIKVSIYTTGILQNVVKAEVELEEDGEVIATVEVTQNDENNYDFKVNVEEIEVTGKMKITKKDDNSASCNIEMNISEFGTIVLDIDATSKFDTVIDTVDESNVVTQDEMTEEDMMEVFEKFQGSKLYEVVNGVSGGMLDMFLGGNIAL